MDDLCPPLLSIGAGAVAGPGSLLFIPMSNFCRFLRLLQTTLVISVREIVC